MYVLWCRPFLKHHSEPLGPEDKCFHDEGLFATYDDLNIAHCTAGTQAQQLPGVEARL